MIRLMTLVQVGVLHERCKEVASEVTLLISVVVQSVDVDAFGFGRVCVKVHTVTLFV